jgi:thioredoxin reductase
MDVVKRALGPSGGYFIHDMVVGKVPMLLGYGIERAEAQGETVHLHLRGQDGSIKEVATDHVIAATGYKVDMGRLRFLSSDIRSKIREAKGSPLLSRTFESSVPGLYFAGVAAANSFGPVMRFAFGASFAARRITDGLAKSVAHHPSRVTEAQLAVSAK